MFRLEKLSVGPLFFAPVLVGAGLGSAPAWAPQFAASLRVPEAYGSEIAIVAATAGLSAVLWLAARFLFPLWDIAKVKVVSMDPGGVGDRHMLSGVWLAEAITNVTLSVVFYLLAFCLSLFTIVILPDIAISSEILIETAVCVMGLYGSYVLLRTYDRYDLYAQMAASNYGQYSRLMPGNAAGVPMFDQSTSGNRPLSTKPGKPKLLKGRR